MPLFRYKARDQHGGLLTGSLDVAGEEAVVRNLDMRGYTPISIEAVRTEGGVRRLLPARFQRSVPLEEIIALTQQLETLFGAGIPFGRSMGALVAETKNPTLRATLEGVWHDVEKGESLSQALGRHPHAFSPLYVSMVRAGEEAGSLPEILGRLAILLEHEIETRTRIKEATRYPKILLGAVGIAFFILITFVIPRFAELYARFTTPLPLPTRIMIGINTLFHSYWHVTAFVTLLLIVLVKMYLATPAGRLRWDSLRLRIPIFGPIFMEIGLSRFARVLGMLHENGLPILASLEITAPVVENLFFARILESIKKDVRNGSGLAESMKEKRIFPSLVLQMVSIGEETGKLGAMLMKVSNHYDRSVDYSLKNLSSLLEPVLLALIGGIVLFFALAIFMPWWNMTTLFRGR